MNVGPLAPRANPTFFGHPEAEKAFGDALRSGRMAHSWLICGPKGVGKATLAYRMARHVLSRPATGNSAQGGLFGSEPAEPAAESLDMAPDHPVFRRILAGGHADLLVIERGVDEKRDRMRKEIVVEDVRDVGAFMNLTSAEGGWRVVIVDSADEMNRNAANAILKVLEEPPARALMLLVSHNPGRLLPTIRSRCRKLTLRPLPAETIARIVRDHVPDLGEQDMAVLAELADGSVGRALALAEEGGIAVFRDLTGLLGTLPRFDIAALHAFAERMARAGQENAFDTAKDVLAWWMTGVLRAAAGAGSTVTGFSGFADFSRIAGMAGLDRWLEVWEKITGLLARADSANLDRKHVFIDVFLMLENAAARS